MRNISDIIEAHLKEIIESNNQNAIEIKRSEVADHFQCVPSQINYVINTRFTVEKGYIVESKRGGGGYIRIIRIQHQDKMQLLNELIKLIEPRVSQQGAIDIIERLLEEELITEREAKLMVSAITREVLAVQLSLRDELRSRILASMLATLKYKE
ncbi:CtsR family transcriptional regulator [Pontibacillus yanchengensis]|uniref:CtsR family transcriptional regulator n=2 Tax=Pontibacillus yanchengensis TaxID=462910 RepID=A0ACC7VKY6_9BACI|nr:CtsR family transcriptional regulator [Pontibacillus yanchengensis]MYL35923.1 CtsR family transcriptional regulator [Pontibacillus yanchengensis]MYL55643.1 CtsR family transcriptional regulator [Pontibacillus yanchengensis]